MNDTPQVKGVSSLASRIKKLREGAVGIVNDSQIATLLESRIRARFEQGVSPDGTPWPGLMQSTIDRKQRKHSRNAKKLLQDTGRLLASLKIIQGGNAGLLAGATGAGVRIGISDPIAAEYGRLHNYGLGQEKRRFIGLSKLDVLAVSGYIRRRLQSIAKE